MYISVAICTYNGEKFIAEQLMSIIRQEQPVDEIIICDDYSSDKTVTIIEEFMCQYPAQVRILQNNRNMGAIRSFEKCIQACSGDIIFLSDQDDVWYPNKVRILLNKLSSDSNVLAVFSNGELIDAEGYSLNSSLWEKWRFTSDLQKKWSSNEFVFTELLLNRNVITGATLAFKKELLPLLLPFELPMGFWHDAWIGLVAAGLGGLRFVEQNTIKYRIHAQQQVGINAGAGDKRFDAITRDQFQGKIDKIFPKKRRVVRAVMCGKESFTRRLKSFLFRVIEKVTLRV